MVPDPSPKLLSIEEIRRAQTQAGRSAAVSEESASESGGSEASCIATSKLLSVEEIQRAQSQASRSAAVVSEESGSESGESEASCIVVRSKRR